MVQRVWKGRGRPPSSGPSCKEGRILENLAEIAMLHKVDSTEFFNRIVEAWNNERSECGQLDVKCRKRMRNSAVFLFTSGKMRARKVVAQFPISITILQGENQLKRYAETILTRPSSVKNLVCIHSKISDLKVGMKKVSLKAEVLKIPKLKIVYTKYGTTGCISNMLIRDETGSIQMSLWNQQIGMMHKGDVVDVKNGEVAWFSGERQLRLGRTGSLSVIKCAQKPREVLSDSED